MNHMIMLSEMMDKEEKRNEENYKQVSELVKQADQRQTQELDKAVNRLKSLEQQKQDDAKRLEAIETRLTEGPSPQYLKEFSKVLETFRVKLVDDIKELLTESERKTGRKVKACHRDNIMLLKNLGNFLLKTTEDHFLLGNDENADQDDENADVEEEDDEDSMSESLSQLSQMSDIATQQTATFHSSTSSPKVVAPPVSEQQQNAALKKKQDANVIGNDKSNNGKDSNGHVVVAVNQADNNLSKYPVLEKMFCFFNAWEQVSDS